MLEVQKFLQIHSLEELTNKFAIKVVRSTKYPELVLLKYSQIESPMSERIVQECRGIILNTVDNYKVVCRTFDKFFNYGETQAAAIDWTSARVFEKLDGSLIQMYYYKDKWNVATSGNPDAAGDVHITNRTFNELFWYVYDQEGYKLPPEELTHLNFAFELCTPYNRVVVDHRTSFIKLIGIRQNDGQELDIRHPELANILDNLGYKIAETYSICNLDGCLEFLKNIKGVEQEGFVVVDSNFNRIKIKGEDYVRLHHLRDHINVPRNVLEIVRTNESFEFLTYFPELTELVDKYKEAYEKALTDIEETYEGIKHIENQKEFALKAQEKRNIQGILFIMRAKKLTASQVIKDMSIKSFEELINAYCLDN